MPTTSYLEILFGRMARYRE